MSMVPCAAPALLLTRQPRQSLPCAALAFPLTRQPRQSIPCAALALPLTRQPRQSHPVRRLSPPAHGAASAVPSRTQTWPSCSRNSLGSPIPCADLAFLLTRQPRQSLPCAAPALLLTRQPWQSLPVRSPGPPAHEEDQNKAFVRERVTFAHGRIVEPFSVARKDCGTLTGCVMALLSLARGVPFVLADRNRR